MFLDRFGDHLKKLDSLTLDAKFNGAVGNYNSHVYAMPEVEWMEYSKNLINQFGFNTKYNTNQRGPMTEIVYFFQVFQNINTMLIDFCRDMWEYASRGNIRYKKVEGNVGSSVMPQKVNPRQFEDAISLLRLANANIDEIVRNSDISRLQRDMTGHAMERSYGETFGKTLAGRTNIVEALKRVEVDEEFNLNELNQHPECI
ncbi:hypothetical protein FACS1894176_09860 [Bacteroidia bacterium]|nr:hypothetical protein FACS1894176_09860 [Bacteroidia bacterium]